jgi:hypothetical protein
MLLSKWKFSPRLMQIKVGNTAVAEGLHTIRDELAELQKQIEEDRKKLPLENIPQTAMLTNLAGKAQACVQQLRTVQNAGGYACKSVYDELNRISGTLNQLHSLLTTMQSRGTELRSFSFDPITEVIAHLSGSLAKLEKRALAANHRRFWPWALLGGATIAGALWMLFNLAASSVFLFGDSGRLDEASVVLLTSLAMAASVAGTAWQFYQSYMPKSQGVSYSGLPYRFWLWAPVSAYGIVLSATLMWESHPIARWLGSYQNKDGDLLGILMFIALVGSVIGAICNVVAHWDDLT